MAAIWLDPLKHEQMDHLVIAVAFTTSLQLVPLAVGLAAFGLMLVARGRGRRILEVGGLEIVGLVPELRIGLEATELLAVRGAAADVVERDVDRVQPRERRVEVVHHQREVVERHARARRLDDLARRGFVEREVLEVVDKKSKVLNMGLFSAPRNRGNSATLPIIESSVVQR